MTVHCDSFLSAHGLRSDAEPTVQPDSPAVPSSPGFYLAVAAGSLELHGVGESAQDARLDAARYRRAFDEKRRGVERTPLESPLSPELEQWAADLLVFCLVAGRP